MRNTTSIEKIALIPVYVYLITIAISAILPFSRPVLIAFIFIIISFIVLLILKKTILLNINVSLILFLLLYACFSLLWVEKLSPRVLKTLTAFTPSLLLINIVYWTKVSIRKLLWIYAISVTVYSLYILLNLNSFFSNISISESVDYINRNAVAIPFGFTLIVLYTLVNRATKKEKYIIIFLSVLNLTVLLLTQSRTPLISALLSMITSLLITNSFKSIISIKRKKSFIYIILFIILFTFLTKMIDFDLSSHRLFTSSKQNYGYDDVSSNRTIIWKNGLMLHNKFIWGSGFASFENEYLKKHNISVNPHNTYIDIYIGLGIIGLILYLSFLVRLMVNYKKIQIDYQKSYLSLILFMFFIGFTNDYFEEHIFWICWFFAISIYYQNKKIKLAK